MEITVRLVDLPHAVGGFVSEDVDGSYSVYINSRWGSSGQRRALIHELKHIKGNDINNCLPISMIENGM